MPVPPEDREVDDAPDLTYYRKNVIFRYECYNGMSEKIVEDFVEGVDMIVQCRRGEAQKLLPGVESLEIRFTLLVEHSHHIDHWISSTVGPNTKRIILVLNMRTDLPFRYSESEFYKFPFEVLLIQKTLCLEHLQLEYICAKLPQNFGGFPVLRTLKLGHIYTTEEDVHMLLIGCPLLEFLRLEYCNNLVALRVSSPLPHLKVLSLWDCEEITSVELWAENLSSFECNTLGNIDDLTLRECYNLTKVAVSGTLDSRPFSDDFPFVRTLYIDSALDELSAMLSKSTFAHLKFLAICLRVEEDRDEVERNVQNLSFLNSFAPMLEEFELHASNIAGRAKCFRKNNKRIDGDCCDHLKRVLFTGFRGLMGETMLAKYFLTKAKGLQIMTIDPSVRSYENFDVKEYYPREIEKTCRNAYKYLCEFVPENAKLILVGGC